MLCGIDPIHLYWIADTEMLESFLIWLDQYSSTISIVYIEIKSVYNELNNFSINRKSGGYGEIGRRYGLNWIEPWYGNLLSDNFQIQRNPGMKKKKGNPEPNPKPKNRRNQNRKKLINNFVYWSISS